MPLNFPPAPTAIFHRRNKREIENIAPNTAPPESPAETHTRNVIPGELLTFVKPKPLPIPMQQTQQTQQAQQENMPVPFPPPSLPFPQQAVPFPPPSLPFPQQVQQSQQVQQAQQVQQIQQTAQPSQMLPPLPSMPLVSPIPLAPSMPLPANSDNPEQAAAQFTRVNSGLPDGVRFEPLDTETMRILQQHAARNDVSEGSPSAASPVISTIPVAPPSMPAPPTMSHMPSKPQPQQVQILSDEATEILRSLAQNERNASIFYTHFAENTSKDVSEVFSALVRDSKARLVQFAAFLPAFIPQETEINIELQLAEAINLALSEEGKGLITLGNLLELVVDTPAEQPISRMVNKKIIGQQLLLSLKHTSVV